MKALIRNLLATAASYAGAYVWTKALSHLVRCKAVKPHAARKVMHITTAPLFALTWPLYTAHPSAAYLAAMVPLSFALRIVVNPTRDTLVRAVALDARASSTPQQGDDDAVDVRYAYGPVMYGVSVAVLTALSWRNNAETYIAMGALCAGDGMADVIGSWLDGPRWPLPHKIFIKRKTIHGSLALFCSSVVASLGMLKVAQFDLSMMPAIWPRQIVTASAAAAAVEVFPVEDNVTVPLVAFVVALFARRFST